MFFRSLLQNCKALQEPKYKAHRAYLFINNVGRDDEGDYTCKFTHTENGTSYIVTATRSFTVQGKAPGFSKVREPNKNEKGKANISCCVFYPLSILCALLAPIHTLYCDRKLLLYNTRFKNSRERYIIEPKP